MGGEKVLDNLARLGVVGSPPHGRGKDVFSSFAIIAHRITPAWAGKSGWRASKKPPGRDHPRMGGEKA